MADLTAVAAYVYAGGFSVGVRRAGFDVLCHLEGDGGYGVDSSKLNWPDLPHHFGPANWPLDELAERNVDFAYANPPCFTGDTKVITAEGPRDIKSLVRERSTVEVLSIDENGNRVLRPITGWHENPYDGDLYDVCLPWQHEPARATAEHRFMTRRGWVAAKDLMEDDEVRTESADPSFSWSRVQVHLTSQNDATKVFCLDVAETHNFVTHGGVVHNCAIFSAMGIRTTRGADGWRTDPRLEHWWDSFRVLERVRPRAWALESVVQGYTRGREVIDEMTKKALMGGYSVTHLLLDASRLGMAQKRRRFFVLAHRPSILIGYRPDGRPAPTVGEVIRGINDVGYNTPLTDERFLRMVRDCRQGEGLTESFNRLFPPETWMRNSRGQVIGRPSFQDQRLDPNDQMGAFIGDKFIHPYEDRYLGIQEGKALCGYPPDFQLAPPERGWPSLLARAVMPPVGQWLAEAVATTLKQEDGRWDQRRVTLVDVRKANVDPVDLTSEYLDDGGRVRLRIKAAGAVTYHVPATAVKKPVGAPVSPTATGTTVLVGVGPRAPETAIFNGVKADVNAAFGKTAVPNSEPRRKVVPAAGSTEHLVASAPASTEAGAERPVPGEGSGKFMQRLWRTTDLTPEEILALVHASYPGRTTQLGDVRYNYYALVKAGEAVRPWPAKRPRAQVGSPPTVRPPAEAREAAPADDGSTTSVHAEAIVPERAGAAPLNEVAVAPRAPSLADRSTVVPERRGHLRRALLYFSKLADPGVPSPISSARIAWFLRDELEFDAVFHAGSYSAEEVPAEIDELWVVNSSWMWMKDEWRRVSMRYFAVANTVVFCQNDYALVLNSYHYGVIRPKTRLAVLTTAPEARVWERYEARPALVNWNVLTYLPRPESDAERREGVYYYGSNRGGRQAAFARYFANPSPVLTVSMSNGEDRRRIAETYPSLNVVGRADDVYAELERWAATLVLEDERSLTTYVSPPNRFYEALSARTPMIFDAASVPIWKRYGYDVTNAAVGGPRELEAKVALAADLAHEQEAWQRDHVGDLSIQLVEARDAIERGASGRWGVPEHLKRYILTEEGGSY